MKSLVVILCAVITVFALAGCQNSSGQLRRVAHDLDLVEDQVTEWGKTTVSELALVKNDGQFKIDYGTNAAFYVNAARNAPNLAERDHQTRQAARLNQHLQHHR